MTGPRTDVTLEEVEAATAAAASTGPKLEDIKLDGEGVPAELKGKTAADLLKMTTGALESLRLSETARKELADRMAAAPPPPAQVIVQQPPVKEPELTKEQLEELYKTDPLAAIDYKQAQSTKRLEENLAIRIGTLAAGSMTAAEQAARSRFPEEFTLFGDQIKKAVDNLPDRGAMVRPEAWDDMVSYIRGKPANFDKIIESRAAKNAEAAAVAARAVQVGEVGAVITPVSTQQTASRSNGKLDDLEKEVAKNLGMSEADYLKWRR